MSKLNWFTWQEPAAYAASALAAGTGLYLAFSHHPDWFGRAGSIVIIVAILLAASRRLDVLQERVRKLQLAHERGESDVGRDVLAKTYGRTPTDEELRALQDAVFKFVAQDVDREVSERRRVFKLHEITLLIAGTLINGFGPWIVGLVKSAA